MATEFVELVCSSKSAFTEQTLCTHCCTHYHKYLLLGKRPKCMLYVFTFNAQVIYRNLCSLPQIPIWNWPIQECFVTATERQNWRWLGLKKKLRVWRWNGKKMLWQLNQNSFALYSLALSPQMPEKQTIKTTKEIEGKRIKSCTNKMFGPIQLSVLFMNENDGVSYVWIFEREQMNIQQPGPGPDHKKSHIIGVNKRLMLTITLKNTMHTY